MTEERARTGGGQDMGDRAPSGRAPRLPAKQAAVMYREIARQLAARRLRGASITL